MHSFIHSFILSYNDIPTELSMLIAALVTPSMVSYLFRYIEVCQANNHNYFEKCQINWEDPTTKYSPVNQHNIEYLQLS